MFYGQPPPLLAIHTPHTPIILTAAPIIVTAHTITAAATIIVTAHHPIVIAHTIIQIHTGIHIIVPTHIVTPHRTITAAMQTAQVIIRTLTGIHIIAPTLTAIPHRTITAVIRIVQANTPIAPTKIAQEMMNLHLMKILCKVLQIREMIATMMLVFVMVNLLVFIGMTVSMEK
jgi:hypothetical protein